MEWNTTMKLWMVGEQSLFSPLYKPFSGRWPISGMMQNGVVYELPMQAHPTTDLEFSLSPTQVLGTPTTATSGRSAEFRKGSNPNPVEFAEDLIASGLLPTPNTMEHREIKTPEQIAELKELSPGGYRNLREVVINELSDALLPTPQALEGHHGNNLSVSYRENQGRQVMLSNHAVDMETNWAKFEPAIRRWEEITRPAPAPTKPDGKEGNHRLSAEFTEWMMGLPEGWVTAEDIGLKRNDQLKACGNGVVPQQAEMALRILLQDLQIESGGGKIAMLPTPTVSDTYTDNLKSSQQKEGSMHSVTLPQAVKQINT
jgi:hypothetical protein